MTDSVPVAGLSRRVFLDFEAVYGFGAASSAPSEHRQIVFDSMLYRLRTDSGGVSVAVRVLWFVVPSKAARSIRKKESGCERSPSEVRGICVGGTGVVAHGSNRKAVR